MHEIYMKTAISLALAAKGQTSPNPTVGAVVVKDGKVIGSGAHLQAGQAHAEVYALEQAGEDAKNADIYVTLEPCAHFGKTPPCAELIVSKKVKRVFIATLDPNPLVAGKGVSLLESAGIDVEVGQMGAEARDLNKEFFHYLLHKTPYVTLKAAMTLDGNIATSTGDSKWITSELARQDAHQYRHWHDGILVGIGTILHDNPNLTTRLPRTGNHPIRIVLDTHLQIPLNSHVVQDGLSETIVICGNQASLQKEAELASRNCVIIRSPIDEVSLLFVLKELGKRQLTSLLVEGGASIHGSFLSEKLFQRLILYMAPTIIGGQNSLNVFGGNGAETISNGLSLTFESIEFVGEDLKIIAKPKGNEVEKCSQV